EEDRAFTDHVIGQEPDIADDGIMTDDAIDHGAVVDASGELLAFGQFDLLGEPAEDDIPLEVRAPHTLGFESLGDADARPVPRRVALALQLGDRFTRKKA